MIVPAPFVSTPPISMTASWLASAFNATMWRRKRTESVRIQAWAYAGGPWGDPDIQWAAVGTRKSRSCRGRTEISRSRRSWMLPCFRGSGNPDERLHGSDGDPFRTSMIVPGANILNLSFGLLRATSGRRPRISRLLRRWVYFRSVVDKGCCVT